MNPIRRLFYKIIQIIMIVRTRRRVVKGHVLLLHKIGFDDDDEFCITPKDFELLISFLQNRHTIRLENWETENDFYSLTIDDVPENFYINAFPILKQNQIPFTLFVSLSLLDTDGYISTEQLFEMVNSGLCTVGSHGVRHVEYSRLNRQEIIADLIESQRKLTVLVHKQVELFAFPFGSYYACGLKNKDLVLDTYKYGFGTVKTPITMPSILPLYFLPRINVDSSYIKQLCY